MDFFEAQERARKRSARLVVLFALAVLGIIAAGYAALVFALFGATLETAAGSRTVDSYWQPDLLAAVSLVTLAVVGGASLFKWLSFRKGGRAVAEMVGARRVDSGTRDLKERQLLNVVEEMAIASGVPLPAVYIMDGEAGINAFAAGLTTSDAVVAVTRGTLEKLTRDELQGVVAHEFSHILNGDMRLNVRLTAIVFGILVIGLIGRGILFNLRFSRPRRNSKGGGGIVAIAAVGLALMAIGYIGYFFGRMIQAAVSRQREYLADAAAVQFTRNPPGISGALRKIGGYTLGSRLLSNRSAQIGHFFFAQGFRSFFGGLWATHPPLVERIRAIEPGFDGKFFEPPTVVDVAREPWSKITGQPPAPPRPSAPAPAAAAIIASVGMLNETAIAGASSLLEAIPEALRDAAHFANEAPGLLYLLLLDPDVSTRNRQLDMVGRHDGPDARSLVERLAGQAESLRPEHRLPLVQLALGVLRDLDAGRLERFLGTLDELVHADARICTFEYALQKMIVHHLKLAQQPSGGPVGELHSFHAVAGEISLALSALAHRSTTSPDRAFAEGSAFLRGLDLQLRFLKAAECGIDRLDAALERLARTSGPIKKRFLLAAAGVATADGALGLEESELLRAIASVLDCPVPPLRA
jgi:Zn-dependent protease with chaperone function